MYEETGCVYGSTNSEVANDEVYYPSLPPPPPPQPSFNAGSSSIAPTNSFEENLKLSAEEFSPSSQLQQQLASGANNNFQVSTLPKETHRNPPPAADLLDLSHLPSCSASTSFLLPNSSVSFISPTTTLDTALELLGDLPIADTASSSAGLYDQLFPLKLPQQPPFFVDLLQSAPPTHNFGCGGSLLLGGGGNDHGEENGGLGRVYPDGVEAPQLFDHGVLEFATEIGSVGKRKEVGINAKGTKHNVSESQKRRYMTNKYEALRSLIPNPTKNDRASVVRDAIGYIQELLRRVDELKLLVEGKRYGWQRIKRHETDVGQPHLSSSASLRSSWLQRKSKDTDVDVRIVEGEVTIKLVQRKKINCLLYVSRVLDDLQLDLQHVAGGHIGDHCSFLLNTKIHEGSCIYGSDIANRLIEVVDGEPHLQVATAGKESFLDRNS